MAETKKYYWLKLKDDFFRDKRIKKLRRIAGGDTYTVIYLKMQLLSIKNNGILIYEDIEESFAEELALELDEEIDNVKVTLAFLHSNEMIEETEPDHFLMTETIKCIGSESASVERVRKHREIKAQSQKALQCNTTVTKCNTEIEKEIEKEKREKSENITASPKPISAPERKKPTKHKYGEYQNVLLTDEELEKLNIEYGEQTANNAITFLDEYIEMKGYKAKSHYLAIRKWVIDALNEQERKRGKSNGTAERQNPFEDIGTVF